MASPRPSPPPSVVVGGQNHDLVVRTANYHHARIFAAVLRSDAYLSASKSALIVYSFLALYADRSDQNQVLVQPSKRRTVLRRLIADTGLAERTVKKALADLKKSGLIVAFRRSFDREGNEYWGDEAAEKGWSLGTVYKLFDDGPRDVTQCPKCGAVDHTSPDPEKCHRYVRKDFKPDSDPPSNDAPASGSDLVGDTPLATGEPGAEPTASSRSDSVVTMGVHDRAPSNDQATMGVHDRAPLGCKTLHPPGVHDHAPPENRPLSSDPDLRSLPPPPSGESVSGEPGSDPHAGSLTPTDLKVLLDYVAKARKHVAWRTLPNEPAFLAKQVAELGLGRVVWLLAFWAIAARAEGSRRRIRQNQWHPSLAYPFSEHGLEHAGAGTYDAAELANLGFTIEGLVAPDALFEPIAATLDPLQPLQATLAERLRDLRPARNWDDPDPYETADGLVYAFFLDQATASDWSLAKKRLLDEGDNDPEYVRLLLESTVQELVAKRFPGLSPERVRSCQPDSASFSW